MNEPTPQPSSPASSSSLPEHQPQRNSSWTSPRSLRQVSLYFAGATFMTASVLITRRTITRRQLSMFPKRFTPSNLPPSIPVNGPFEALEALNLATLNTMAFAIMMGGGLAWAMDISNLEDLRRKVRRGIGVDETGRSEGDEDEEIEEWIASVLERKAGKEKAKRLRGEEVEEKMVNERGKER